MDTKRIYEKGNPQEPLLEVESEASVDKIPNLKITYPSLSSGYKKSESFQDPLSFIVIFSGGEFTEKEYFRLINNPNRFPRIKINIYTETIFEKRTDDIKCLPKLFQTAYSKVQEYKESSSTDSPDSFFIITDVDEFYDAIKIHKPECEKQNIKLIISNPCFEVWLYYSKNEDKFSGFLKPENELKLSQAIKKYVHQSVPCRSRTKNIIFDIEINIQNALKNYSEDSNGIPDEYSTNMFVLASEILPYIKDDLANLKSEAYTSIKSKEILK